jgi:TonB-linked SusC/RagA family outer membrane protein
MRKIKQSMKSKSKNKLLVICALFFFLTPGFAWAIESNATAQTVTAIFRNMSLTDVIWELQKQTDFTFIYSTSDVQSIKVDNVAVEKEELTEVLDKCLEKTNLSYTVKNGVIAIKQSAKRASVASVQQERTQYTGTIVDETGEPLIGVNVIIKGTTQGTITDIDGNFELLGTQQSVTLISSFIGYATVETTVKAGEHVKITLKEDELTLDEVVVTGYGTFKKSAYAGSASTVKVENMEDVPATSFAQLLQGSAPGVQISSSSGAVGGSNSIMIRGVGSFNASTSPLYVIDGIPVTSSISSNIDGGTDIMSTLNNSDIENITVIKDAAAASLYGSRAANGVILITTKSGKEGKAAFNLKADWGFSDYATNYRDVMDGPERRATIWEGLYNQGVYLKEMTKEEATAYADSDIDKYAPMPWSGWEDWESALFRKHAPYQNYEFSASGGDRKLSYYMSAASTDQKGIVRQQDFSRITGRLNVKYNMTEKLQLGANILYSSLKQHGSAEGGTYTSPIYSTRHKVSASDPIYNEDGTYNVNLLGNDNRNPKSQLDLNYKRQEANRSFNTVFANYKFIPGLVFNTTFSLDQMNSKYTGWSDPRSTDGANDNGTLSANSYQYQTIVWKNNLTYNVAFKDFHHLDVLGGYEVEQYKRTNISGSVKDFATVEKHQLSNGANISGLSGGESAYRLLSYIGRLNYDYKNKYYFGGSARLDGTSRLHRNSRWGTFWSVSGAWRLTAENFMESVSHIFTDAKIRASYGTNGTQPSEYFGYMSLVGFKYAYNGKPGMLEYQVGNELLSWEKNYNLNLGIDFNLFNRVSATVEFYNRNTADLLLDKPLSKTTGFNSVLTNIGRVNNKGVEVNINAGIIKTKDFSWNSSLNFGHNKNKIVDLGGQEEMIGTYTIRKVGLPYYMFYVKEFAGINPDSGYAQYYVNGENSVDENGNRITTEDPGEANYIIHKGADPTLSGGWTNTLKYKWFDLNFTWTFSLGGYSYDNAAQKLEHGGVESENAISVLYRDRWKNPGDRTNIEIFMMGNPNAMHKVVSSRRIHSSDYLRLKNVTLGVSAPKNWVQKIRLENVRAYFSAVNLLTFAAYDLYDPEVPRNGVVYFEAPKMKTLTFGLDIKF